MDIEKEKKGRHRKGEKNIEKERKVGEKGRERKEEESWKCTGREKLEKKRDKSLEMEMEEKIMPFIFCKR